MVAFNFSQKYRQQRFARKLSSMIGGYEGALPDTYGKTAEELAALMNEWRQRAVALESST